MTPRRLLTAALTALLVTGLTAIGSVPAQAASHDVRYVLTTTWTYTRASTTAPKRTKVRHLATVTVRAKRPGWVSTTKGWLPTSAVSRNDHYADRIAAQHGLRVQYTNDQWCGKRSSANTARSFQAGGCYLAYGTLIQLTTSMTYSGHDKSRRALVYDLVSHESAHWDIARRPKARSLGLSPARMEHVADAFAYTYFHTAHKNPGGYGFGKADVALAKKIHALPAR